MSCWALSRKVESVNELGLDRLSCWALTVYGRVESVNEPLGLDRLRKS